MHPRDFNFSLKTGSNLVDSKRPSFAEIDSSTLNIIGMSMVFFEEAVKDASKYCSIKEIGDITDKEIIMSLQAQLLRNDGVSFLDTMNLVNRSLEYCDVLTNEEYEDECEEEEQKERVNEVDLMSDEDKQKLISRFEYASSNWNNWHPDPESNQMAFLMRSCIQSTIDKFSSNNF